MIKKFNVIKTRKLNAVNQILKVFIRKPVPKEIRSLSEVRKILIVDFSLIGDMVMAIPFLRAIRKNCPRAKVTLVAMPWSEQILGDQGLVDEFLIFDGKNCLSSAKEILINLPKTIRVIKAVRKQSFDIGIEPKGDMRHMLFMHFMRCDRTIGYDYTGGNYLVTECYKPRKDTEHLIDEKMDLLKLAGFSIDGVSSVPSIYLNNDLRKKAEVIIRKNNLTGRIYGIHPGTENKNKRYRHFDDIASYISEKEGKKCNFLIFEGEHDKESADCVCKKLDGIHAKYLRIKQKLKDYIAVMSLCDYVICNDSSAGHIAAALDIPVLVIFGAVNSKTAIPKGKNKVIGISHDIECKPCTLPDCPKGTYECLESIKFTEVKRAIDGLTKTGE